MASVVRTHLRAVSGLQIQLIYGIVRVPKRRTRRQAIFQSRGQRTRAIWIPRTTSEPRFFDKWIETAARLNILSHALRCVPILLNVQFSKKKNQFQKILREIQYNLFFYTINCIVMSWFI